MGLREIIIRRVCICFLPLAHWEFGASFHSSFGHGVKRILFSRVVPYCTFGSLHHASHSRVHFHCFDLSKRGYLAHDNSCIFLRTGNLGTLGVSF
jgi:hypothetical protein